jgi:hypothetical protein
MALMNLDSLNEKQLLDLKLKDLPLIIKGSWLGPAIEQLESEISARNLELNLHFWISTEWFVPDGVSGIAIPFYLFHPKLMALEKKYFSEAEGETYKQAMKLLRHEAGHAIDNAFRLKLMAGRCEAFGDHSIEYPLSYEAKPFTKSFVHHLKDGYAQAHPEEDWAETFAVWLGDKQSWQTKYIKWPAFEKLCYMDYVMSKFAFKTPKLRNKRKVDAISTLNITLRDYIKQKRERLGLSRPVFIKEVKKLGTTSRQFKRSLQQVLRSERHEICQKVAKRTQEKHYRINRMYSQLGSECKLGGLLDMPVKSDSKEEIIKLLSRKSRTYFQGRHKVVM